MRSKFPTLAGKATLDKQEPPDHNWQYHSILNQGAQMNKARLLVEILFSFALFPSVQSESSLGIQPKESMTSVIGIIRTTGWHGNEPKYGLAHSSYQLTEINGE